MSELQMALLSEEEEGNRRVKLEGWTCRRERDKGGNAVRNQRYSALSFVPRVLFQQFRYFFNLFYLLTALSQFIPALKVGLLFSFVAPLALVLALTMAKEGYEDFQRHLRDKEINEASCTLFFHPGGVSDCQAQDLCVGDLLELKEGQYIPADCILLCAAGSNPTPTVFLKTDQLDGETDWKLRKAVFTRREQIEDSSFHFGEPVAGIYTFVGSTEVRGMKVGMGLEHTLWRATKLAAGSGLALVVYVGSQTKLSLNMRQPEAKFGQLDAQLNMASKALFGLLLALAMMLTAMRGRVDSAPLFFFKYFLLLSSIIPISMRVNLDFAKLSYKWRIDHDEELPDALCRNSDIPEQLGRIDCILSDKTGTLTQNEMIFRRLYLSQSSRCDERDLKQLLQNEQKGVKSQLQQTMLALALCHNVTPLSSPTGRTLHGSSPDEVALVSFAQSLGYKLLNRSEDAVALSLPSLASLHQNTSSYSILQLFPFTSETKSMGILLQRIQFPQEMIYFLKGADSVMATKVSIKDSEFLAQACMDLAQQGFRTLVFACRSLTPEFYVEWKLNHNQATAALFRREELIARSRLKLESQMKFLGVTGVEDKLQEGVAETVGALRSIGLGFGMLTGDKVETAICIGRAIRLIDAHSKVITVTGKDEVKTGLLQITGNCVLVMDGQALRVALFQHEQQLQTAVSEAKALICSRVSPTQKAQIAAVMIKSGKRVLGVGDGGNDVALIQRAHVGVGVYGKEGVQAALASDFSISGFAQLGPLLLWHGRLAQRRSAGLAQFVMHRGVIFTVMQFIFIVQYYLVPLPIYNGLLLLGYSTVFTMLPVFSLVLDEDISRKVALTYPVLYRHPETEVSPASFTYWLLISTYQGTVIMVGISLVPNSFYLLTTLSFTCLIIIEFLNVLSQLHRLRSLQILSILISLALYIACMFLLHSYLHGIILFTSSCLPITLVIVSLAWIPPFFILRLQKHFNPSPTQKIMRIPTP